MSKKKVRIYKAPDGKGQYINKTAQFIGKMQSGGQPSVDQLGYPGSQQESQPVTEEQLMQAVYQDISDELPYEAIVAKLVTIHNIEPSAANQFVQQVYGIIENDISKEKSDEAEAEEEAEPVEVEEIENEIVREKRPMSKIKGHTDIAMEDTGEEDVELEDEDMLKYGGMPRMQEGGQDYTDAMYNDTASWEDSEVPITMPDVSDYLPFDISEYLNNDAAPVAWQEPAEEEEEIPEEDLTDYAEPVVDPSEFRMGGFKTKKGYVNSVVKLIKKAAGGDNKEQDIKASDADPIGDDLRQTRLDAFVGAVKKESDLSVAKEEAEKQFEDMQAMHQQMMMQQPEGLNNFIPEDYEEPEYMQFGGQRRAMRQLNRAMRKSPMGIPGIHGPVTKFDVRRSGIFGRPKEYSIEFGESPLMQLAGNPFLSQAYGYGYTKKKTKTPGRMITETVRNTVNNKSTKDVAKATGSEAAAKSAWDLDQNLIPDSIQSNVIESKAKTRTPDPIGTAVAASKAATPVVPPMANAPVSSNPADEIFGKNPPRVGETNSAYLLRTTGNPGFYNNTDLWNGTEFVKTKDSKIKEKGGIINNPMPDQFGNLQQFVYGGLDQADIDDVYATDTTDPYMPEAQYGMGINNMQNPTALTDYISGHLQNHNYGQKKSKDTSQNKTTNTSKTATNPYASAYGYNPQSLFQTYFPANFPQRVSYSKMKRGPYDKASGQQFANIPGFNPYAQIKDVNVTKVGLLGRPKKYSVTYSNNPSGKPEDRKLAYPNTSTTKQQQGVANQSTEPKSGYSNTAGLSGKAQRQIRQGEREMARNDRKVARNPEGNVPFMLNAPGKGNQDNVGMGTKMKMFGAKLAGADQKQYGGDLERFIPQALLGNETPVSMVNNPANSDLRMPIKSSKEVGQQLMMDSRKKVEGEADYMPDEYTVDYKAKNKWLGDNQGAILSTNAAVQGVTGMIDRFKNKDREAKMYDNLTADNLYAADPSRDSGDYDVNSGLYRPNEQGQTWNSRSAKYGGDSNYAEGDEVEMTEEELAEFLANGGQVEYLNY
jgi:hypothetical protein